MTFKENYQMAGHPMRAAAAMADSQVAKCKQAWLSASSPHHFPHCKQQQRVVA